MGGEQISICKLDPKIFAQGYINVYSDSAELLVCYPLVMTYSKTQHYCSVIRKW